MLLISLVQTMTDHVNHEKTGGKGFFMVWTLLYLKKGNFKLKLSLKPAMLFPSQFYVVQGPTLIVIY